MRLLNGGLSFDEAILKYFNLILAIRQLKCVAVRSFLCIGVFVVASLPAYQKKDEEDFTAKTQRHEDEKKKGAANGRPFAGNRSLRGLLEAHRLDLGLDHGRGSAGGGTATGQPNS